MTARPQQLRIPWDDLRLFLEIARAGTLTGAAARLRLSQPTAGRRLRALEEAVGAALFQRTPAGFVLTDEGDAMLHHAEHMEEDAIAIERKLLGGARELEGILRLSASDWFAARVLARPLAAFTIEHPGVTVELIAASRRLDLQRREADLVFRFVPFSGADIVQRRLVRVCYGAYASPDYLARCGDPAASEAGSGHQLVTMDSMFGQMPDITWLRARWPEARLSVRSNNREAQGVACVAGAGIAVLPRAIGDTLPLERLGGGEPPRREIRLGYHRDLKRLRRLRMLVDHLTGVLPAEV